MNPVPMNLSKAYRCHPCEMDISIGDIATHHAGKKHRIQCAKFEAAKLEVAMPSIRASSNPVTKHMTSTSHLTAVKRATRAVLERTPPTPTSSAPAVPADSFHCGICNRTRKLAGYDLHLESEFHRNAMLLLQPVVVAIEPPAPPPTMLVSDWLCEICKIYCHINIRDAHLGSKKHVENVKLSNTTPQLREMLTPVVMPQLGFRGGGGRGEKLVSDWHCEICDIHYRCTTRETHIGSEGHLTNIGRVPIPVVVKPPAPPPTMLDSDWHCEICDIHYRGTTRETHIRSMGHLKEVGRVSIPVVVEPPAPPPTMLDSDWHCEICDIHYRGTTREAHISSRKHINKAGGIRPGRYQNNWRG